MPDLNIIHSQTLLIPKAANNLGGFSPKTTAAALLASEPGHKSQTAITNTNKFSPHRPAGPIYGVGGSDESAAEQDMHLFNEMVLAGDDISLRGKGRATLHPLLQVPGGQNSEAAMNRSLGTILATSEATVPGPGVGAEAASAASAS